MAVGLEYPIQRHAPTEINSIPITASTLTYTSENKNNMEVFHLSEHIDHTSVKIVFIWLKYLLHI